MFFYDLSVLNVHLLLMYNSFNLQELYVQTLWSMFICFRYLLYNYIVNALRSGAIFSYYLYSLEHRIQIPSF